MHVGTAVAAAERPWCRSAAERRGDTSRRAHLAQALMQPCNRRLKPEAIGEQLLASAGAVSVTPGRPATVCRENDKRARFHWPLSTGAWAHSMPAASYLSAVHL